MQLAYHGGGRVETSWQGVGIIVCIVIMLVVPKAYAFWVGYQEDRRLDAQREAKRAAYLARRDAERAVKISESADSE